MDPVIVAMATFPPRRQGMVEVVNALLPQCDKFYLYLNGYTSVPEELPKSDKLVCVCAGPGCAHADIGSQGKFFWVGQDEGYYLTVDDDIFYPQDYVAYMVACVDKYSRKAIVGLHGSIFRLKGGARLPPRNPLKDCRTLYPYNKKLAQDLAVHVLGAGVMACYPKAIGLTFDACKGPVHSGDDEDIAIWGQRNNVALVKVATEKDWVRPNPAMWVRDPLHRRAGYIQSADTKLRAWSEWAIRTPPEPTVATQAPVPPIRQRVPDKRPLALRMAEAREQRLAAVRAAREQALAQKQRPQAQPAHPVECVRSLRPASGPCFDLVELSSDELAFTNKILSSDALAAQIITRIKQRIPTSVIRMSDGERAIMEFAVSGKTAGFLKDPAWLKRYGLEGADLKSVGENLTAAGMKADYLACTISGLFWEIFKVHDRFPQRAQFIDQFYPQLWAATDRVGAVLRAGPVLVLHRQHADIVPKLTFKYGLAGADGMMLNSWKDQPALLDKVAAHPAQTVLVSGGASGKPFAVALAQATGKVVLDVGEALTGVWLTDMRGWHDAAGRPMMEAPK